MTLIRGEDRLALPVSILLLLAMVVAGLVGVRATLQNALPESPMPTGPGRGLNFDLSLPPHIVPTPPPAADNAAAPVVAPTSPTLTIVAVAASVVPVVSEAVAAASSGDSVQTSKRRGPKPKKAKRSRGGEIEGHSRSYGKADRVKERPGHTKSKNKPHRA